MPPAAKTLRRRSLRARNASTPVVAPISSPPPPSAPEEAEEADPLLLPPPPFLSCCCSSDDEQRHTHPWKTFDFDQIRNSKRFNYLADPLLIRGYSIQKRRRDVLLSLFAWHNETINVWSHLLGGILFVCLFASWWCSTHLVVPSATVPPLSTTSSPALHHSGISFPPSVWLNAQQHRGEELFLEYATVFSRELEQLKLSANQYIATAAAASSLKSWLSHMSDRSEAVPSWLLHGEEEEALFSNSLTLHQALLAQPQQTLERSTRRFRRWVVHEKDLLAEKLDDGAAWMRRRVSVAEWVKSSLGNATSPLAILLREHLLRRHKDAITYDSIAHLYFHQDETTELVEDTVLSLAVPLWPMLVFCFGGTMCLFCSAIYHLFVGYHCNTYNMLCRVDLAGISFMIWGSCVPLIYYVFYDEEHSAARLGYLSGLTIMCALTLLFTMLPAQHMHRAKVPRVAAYIVAGGFSVAPLVHAMYTWGASSQEVQRYSNDGKILIVGALYVFGAFIYISRFPEKHFPGYFDFVFASHQIWHLTVFAAAVVHYYGLLELYLWRVSREHAVAAGGGGGAGEQAGML